MFKLRVWGASLLSISLACLIVLGLSSSASADAPQPLHIQLSPLPIELSATPGKSVSTPLRIRNTGTKDEVLKVSLQDVTQDGANGQVEIRPFNSNNPLPSWVHFSQDVFTAPAGEWQTINMTVNLPKSAAYGYYYAVQFSLANNPSSHPGQTGIQGAADIFVLLNAEAPGEIAKADITTFTVDRKYYEYLPVNFTVRIHNSGNIHVAPYGNIFISRGKSRIGSINVNSTLGNILPGSNRLFTASWNDGFPVYVNVLDGNGQTISNGHGGAKQELTWNLGQVPKLRFGHYTAELVMVYSNGTSDIPITATASFWVIPWRLILIIIAIPTIPSLLVYLIMKRRYKKRLNNTRKHENKHETQKPSS